MKNRILLILSALITACVSQPLWAAGRCSISYDFDVKVDLKEEQFSVAYEKFTLLVNGSVDIRPRDPRGITPEEFQRLYGYESVIRRYKHYMESGICPTASIPTPQHLQRGSCLIKDEKFSREVHSVLTWNGKRVGSRRLAENLFAQKQLHQLGRCTNPPVASTGTCSLEVFYDDAENCSESENHNCYKITGVSGNHPIIEFFHFPHGWNSMGVPFVAFSDGYKTRDDALVSAVSRVRLLRDKNVCAPAADQQQVCRITDLVHGIPGDRVHAQGYTLLRGGKPFYEGPLKVSGVEVSSEAGDLLAAEGLCTSHYLADLVPTKAECSLMVIPSPAFGPGSKEKAVTVFYDGQPISRFPWVRQKNVASVDAGGNPIGFANAASDLVGAGFCRFEKKQCSTEFENGIYNIFIGELQWTEASDPQGAARLLHHLKSRPNSLCSD